MALLDAVVAVADPGMVCSHPRPVAFSIWRHAVLGIGTCPVEGSRR